MLRWIRLQATCTGFIELLSPIPVDEFAKRLVESKSVLILPASIYDLNTNHFRIGFGRRNFAEALSLLESFL